MSDGFLQSSVGFEGKILNKFTKNALFLGKWSLTKNPPWCIIYIKAPYGVIAQGMDYLLNAKVFDE